jgi:hypothetical protein
MLGDVGTAHDAVQLSSQLDQGDEFLERASVSCRFTATAQVGVRTLIGKQNCSGPCGSWYEHNEFSSCQVL